MSMGGKKLFRLSKNWKTEKHISIFTKSTFASHFYFLVNDGLQLSGEDRPKNACLPECLTDWEIQKEKFFISSLKPLMNSEQDRERKMNEIDLEAA